MLKRPVECDLPCDERALEQLRNFSRKSIRRTGTGKEESGPTGDPPGAVDRDATTSDQAVDVRMVFEVRELKQSTPRWAVVCAGLPSPPPDRVPRRRPLRLDPLPPLRLIPPTASSFLLEVPVAPLAMQPRRRRGMTGAVPFVPLLPRRSAGDATPRRLLLRLPAQDGELAAVLLLGGEGSAPAHGPNYRLSRRRCPRTWRARTSRPEGIPSRCLHGHVLLADPREGYTANLPILDNTLLVYPLADTRILLRRRSTRK